MTARVAGEAGSVEMEVRVGTGAEEEAAKERMWAMLLEPAEDEGCGAGLCKEGRGVRDVEECRILQRLSLGELADDLRHARRA